MAKIIQLTEKEFIELRSEFEQALRMIKSADGKVNFQKTFPSFDRKATLYFTSEAYEKMRALVDGFDKEVAWHGVAERMENDVEDGYLISDILVYPQTVTGTTVDMDADEYDAWIRNNATDERMFRLRMQGHSHVHMAVSPSSVDIEHQKTILNMIPKNGFYIFVIANKKGDMYVKIYDTLKNVLFEEKDVSVKILEPAAETHPPVFENVTEEEEKALRAFLDKLRSEKRTKEFMSAAKAMVKEHKPYVGSMYGAYQGSSYYNYGAYAGTSTNTVKSTAVSTPVPVKTEAKPAAPAKEESKPSGKKRKGKRKVQKKSSGRIGFYDGPEDDDDDFYDYFRRT